MKLLSLATAKRQFNHDYRYASLSSRSTVAEINRCFTAILLVMQAAAQTECVVFLVFCVVRCEAASTSSHGSSFCRVTYFKAGS